MGLHFHNHRARTYKEQGREEVRNQVNAEAVASPLDQLIEDIQTHVLKVQAGVPLLEAKARLDREARQFIAAIRNYKELFNKPVNTPNVPSPEIVPPKPKP